jgi:hypothetical protein
MKYKLYAYAVMVIGLTIIVTAIASFGALEFVNIFSHEISRTLWAFVVTWMGLKTFVKDDDDD